MAELDPTKQPFNRTDLVLSTISGLSTDSLASRPEVFRAVRSLAKDDDRFPYPVNRAIAESLAYLTTNGLISVEHTGEQPLGGWQLTPDGDQRLEHIVAVS